MAYIDQIQYMKCIGMSTMDEIDNITKNIVNEISRECKSKHTIVDDGFCIYFVQLLVLDPKWGISSECQLNRENISKLVNYCIEQLIQKGSPYHINCLTQHLWMTQPQTRNQFILNYRRALKRTLQPLVNDILNFKYDKDDSYDSKVVKQKLMKKLVFYTILASGLGHPKNPKIMTETTNALGSVFKFKNVVAFCTLKTKPEKETELDNLMNLVCGIRLLNEKMKKTKSGILEFHDTFQNAINVTHRELSKNLNIVIDRVHTLTLIIEMCFQLGESSSGMYILTRKEIDFDPIYISYLIAYRQQEIFLRQILHEIETIKHNTDLLIENDFNNVCMHLTHILKYKVIIPAAEVYPLFTELAEIQWKIQDEAILLENYNRIMFRLVKLMKEINYDSKFFKKLDKGVDTNEKIKKHTLSAGLKIQIHDNKCKVFDYYSMGAIQLEYLGFCPWVIVQTEGGLIPGNPELGVIKYKKKAYIFSCVEGAVAFVTDPERYIMHILDIARVRTDLIHLLQIHHQLISVHDVPVLYMKPPKVITTDGVGIQTELHPIESNIDRKYRWNIWDMYKDAVHYANVSKCKTRSTQTSTNFSNWRHPVQVQTIEYRSKIMQTKTDNYTNVRTLSNFLFGLRGRTDNNQHIIDLTRPIVE